MSILRARPHIHHLCCSFGIRRLSTIISDTGRVYTIDKLIYRHPEGNKIYKAESAGQAFVLKHVPEQLFSVNQQVANDFSSTKRLRIHTDASTKDSILVYPYLRESLLDFDITDPELPPPQRLKIMRVVAEAVAELHAKGWIHADIKPDNVLLDWTEDDLKKVVTSVVLGDFDIARQLGEGKALLTQDAIGNVMWRSPEAQTGVNIPASDVYSLGLVFFYILGVGELLILDDNVGFKLLGPGHTPEQEVVVRHFAFFGPVPENLYNRYMPDEAWKTALRGAAQAADQAVAATPDLRLRYWGQEMTESTLQLLSQMNNLDPGARPTMQQVLEHPFWEDDMQ